jgi:hypothetical protein
MLNPWLNESISLRKSHLKLWASIPQLPWFTITDDLPQYAAHASTVAAGGCAKDGKTPSHGGDAGRLLSPPWPSTRDGRKE